MRLGRYEVTDKIGRGAMGVVYRGRDANGNTVAIKVLRSDEGDAVKRFDRECRLQGAFTEKEGFVPLLDSGVAPEGPFLVMPFLTGGTLRERLKGPVPLDESVELGLALSRALAKAHERGIVHRDLKPDNVLFTDDGRPLVADLGLAKHFRRDAPGASQSVNLTERGEMAGTAGYLAPEQMTDARSVTATADVFGLGAMLYELLAGKPAFDAQGALAKLTLVAKGQVKPLRELRPEVPVRLEAIVHRALAPNPKDRFPSAGALAQALEEIAGKRTTGQRRRTLAFGALFVVVLILVGFGGVAVARLALATKTAPTEGPRQPPPPPTPPVVRAQENDPIERVRELLRKHDAEGARIEAVKAMEALEGKPALAARACALRALAEAIEEKDADALTHADQALATNDHLPEALCARGIVQYRDPRSRRKASATLEQALELDRELAVAWAWLARAQLDEAGADSLEGRALALKDAEKAIELDAGLAEAYLTRALARSTRQRIDPDALTDLTRATELDAKSPRAWYHRAGVYQSLQEHERAISDFTRVIELAPGDHLAFRERSRSYFALGRYDEAQHDCDKAIQLAPDDAIAWLFRSDVREKLDDPRGQLKDLEEAVRRANGSQRDDFLFRDARARLAELRSRQ
jgi:tetratricopeptide (TPR) repeat protein